LEYPEFQRYIAELISPQWLSKVNDIKTRLIRGKEIAEQINILGDDGVPTEYHVVFWKSELIDYVVLQQDAFDPVDSVTPLERQEYILDLVTDICRRDLEFRDFNEVMEWFKRLINLCKQQNYAEYKSADFYRYEADIQAMLAEKSAQQ
jgi:V/A-type H+-transporting ATPase subunit A